MVPLLAMRHFLLVIALFFCSFLQGMTKIVEVVANMPINPPFLTEALTKRGYLAQVRACDLSRYGVGLKKWGLVEKYLHKWSLDFWKSIPVEKGVEKIVFFNLISRHRRDFKLGYLPKDKLVLFLFEPPVVLPKMYKESTFKYFGKIYTWDDDLVDGVQFFKFYYPVLRTMLPDLPLFEDKKLCTLVNSCLKSRKRNSLYEERKKAIAFFEEIGEEGFEFYGRKWDASQYKSYRGCVDDKLQAMKHYRFSICYENCADRKGYITEKIFDSFAAGCVPVYWGAPNVERYIPKDCFIDRRNFTSMQELHAFLKNMDKTTYEGYIARIRAFLDTPQARLFSQENFDDLFFEATQ